MKIYQKFKKVYSEDGELLNNNKNIIKLTQEEVDYLTELIIDLMINEYRGVLEFPEELESYKIESLAALENETLKLSNDIL
ncbi:MAG: hypothetical protein ACFFAA_03775 [Promethearchaeota archaeon]